MNHQVGSQVPPFFSPGTPRSKPEHDPCYNDLTVPGEWSNWGDLGVWPSAQKSFTQDHGALDQESCDFSAMQRPKGPKGPHFGYEKYVDRYEYMMMWISISLSLSISRSKSISISKSVYLYIYISLSLYITYLWILFTAVFSQGDPSTSRWMSTNHCFLRTSWDPKLPVTGNGSKKI